MRSITEIAGLTTHNKNNPFTKPDDYGIYANFFKKPPDKNQYKSHKKPTSFQ